MAARATQKAETVRSTDGQTWTLAPRTKTGEGPCPGEAHTNPFIDNCMLCAPRWGCVDVYAAPILEQVVKEGFAVPVSHVSRISGSNDPAFVAAEKKGAIRMVMVTQKIGRKSSASYCVYVASKAKEQRARA